MIHVKLTTCAPGWPWKRQTPGCRGEWGPFHFIIDEPAQACDLWVVFESVNKSETCLCPPQRTIFVTGEPDSIGWYSPDFLAQFHTVVTSRRDVQHPRIVRMQQGHPWFVERTFDELLAMQPIQKTQDICVISSDKSFTRGHRQRLDFVKVLQEALGHRIDVFGRGIRDFDSKWDLLARYRYAVVLENFVGDDFLTEKLPDAWLAYCFPFYAGCTNLACYFPDGGWAALDMLRPSSEVTKIRAYIEDPTHYMQHLPAIAAARQHYLLYSQFFPNLASVMQNVIATTPYDQRSVTLRPHIDFAEPSGAGRLIPYRWGSALLSAGRLLSRTARRVANKTSRFLALLS